MCSLSKTLAEWFDAREGLSREGLEVMLTRIRGDLAGVRAAATADGDDILWRTRVVAPLRLTVAGLVEMIDRRQRGMDVQQQETRERIGHMREPESRLDNRPITRPAGARDDSLSEHQAEADLLERLADAWHREYATSWSRASRGTSSGLRQLRRRDLPPGTTAAPAPSQDLDGPFR